MSNLLRQNQLVALSHIVESRWETKSEGYIIPNQLINRQGLRQTGKNGMHTIEILDQAVTVAQELGYSIRQEWLGGVGGGECEFAGRKWIFIDLSLSVLEQLDQVVEAIQADEAVYSVHVPPELASMIRPFGRAA